MRCKAEEKKTMTLNKASDKIIQGVENISPDKQRRARYFQWRRFGTVLLVKAPMEERKTTGGFKGIRKEKRDQRREFV